MGLSERGDDLLGKDVLARYCDRLDELQRQFIRRMHLELAGTLDEGLTGEQFMLMHIINDRGRMTVSEVAEELCVSLSAVTARVDRLCRTGMVVRNRSAEDRRVVLLDLTDEGRSVVDVCLSKRRKLIQRYMGQLDEIDLIHMIEIYGKILSIMQQEEKLND